MNNNSANDLGTLNRNLIPNGVIYVNKTLTIETYIIGYKSEGEAILFFIRADSVIYFSGLTDCYTLKGTDKVKEILLFNGVHKLDFICWTHPDFDHSKGLKDVIEQFASEDTYIWIPEGVDSKEIDCSEEVMNLFGLLKKCVTSDEIGLNVYTVSDVKDMMCYNKVYFRKGIKDFPLCINSYAPNSNMIRKQTYLEKFIRNDRSIFFIISLGEAQIWLTGDIEDETIERLPDYFQGKHVHILKIPHHGSSSSSGFLNLGFTECDVACSTVYRKGKNNLPVDQVMIQYQGITTELFCTGRKNPQMEIGEYGVLKVVTNVLDNSYTTEIEGNAEKWGC